MKRVYRVGVVLAMLALVGCTPSEKPIKLSEVESQSLGDIQRHVSGLYKDGSNISMASEDDSWFFIYNSEKDCYAESSRGYAMVYTPNGDVTVFNNKVVQKRDVNPLGIIENASALVGYGQANMECLPGIKGESENLYIIRVEGYENIVKMYSRTLGEADASKLVEEYLLKINPEFKPKELDLVYTLKIKTTPGLVEELEVSGESVENISLTDTSSISVDTSLKVGEDTYSIWKFSEVVGIGDWSMPKGWGDVNTTEEEWKELYKELTETLKSKIEDRRKEINPEASTEEDTQGNEEEYTLPDELINFKENMFKLLESDGILDIDTAEFDVPVGYSYEDKEKMLSLYEKVRDWEGKVESGMIIYPIDMDEIEFIQKYIYACEESYKKELTSKETDTYGTIFWKDTLGLFIQLIS